MSLTAPHMRQQGPRAYGPQRTRARFFLPLPPLEAKLAARALRRQLLDGRAVLAGAASGAAVVVVVVGGGGLLAERAHLAERGLPRDGWSETCTCTCTCTWARAGDSRATTRISISCGTEAHCTHDKGSLTSLLTGHAQLTAHKPTRHSAQRIMLPGAGAAAMKPFCTAWARSSSAPGEWLRKTALVLLLAPTARRAARQRV